MSNEERLARLTELARRVPGWKDAVVEYGRHVITVWGQGSEPGEQTLLLTIRHAPSALDALEAALCVLAGDALAEDMLRSLQSWWERHAVALRMTSRSVHHALGVAISALEQGKPFPTMQVLTGADAAEPPAWVDELATKWEQWAEDAQFVADDPVTGSFGQRSRVAASSLRECAAELRARAKGKR